MQNKFLDPRLIAKLPPIALKAIKIVEGVLSGLHRSPHRGQSIEFSQHKEYSPGDDIRHVDWKVFARRDRYYIKQFEEETNVRAYLLIDGSSSMLYPDAQGVEERPSKYHYAGILALSIAYVLLRQGDAVGLSLFQEGISETLPPKSKPSYLLALAESLEKFQPGGKTSLSEALSQLAEIVKKRSLILIFSDLFEDSEKLKKYLKQLSARGHDISLFQILDRDELEFPFREQTLFEDLEDSSRQLTVDAYALKKYYLDELKKFLQTVERSASESQIEYRLLSTKNPPEQYLREFLSRRQRLKFRAI